MIKFLGMALALAALLTAGPAWAATGAALAGPAIGPVPLEFVFFGGVLACVALFHHFTLQTALGGAIVIALYKILFSPFKTGAGVGGFVSHLGHEWVILVNLLLLLLGFALLADLFEKSEVPTQLPRYLPDDWKGGFVLLVAVFVLSSFLDNIAAAMIGGAIAHTVFKGKVHIGYLAGIVAASNAGGAGSVVGDTTTTMMWIAGIAPTEVLEAFIASGVALCICGVVAARQQHAHSPIQKDADPNAHIDWVRVGIVAFILAAAITVNVLINTRFNEVSDLFPFLGAAVWAAILASTVLRQPNWGLLPGALRGSVFLLSLVLCASMMPVEHLPAASWPSALGLGFLSAVFDNIPLTRAGAEAGRLRLGLPGLRGGLWRLDDLVRVVGRRGLVQHVPAGAFRGPVAAPRLARGRGLRGGLLRDAGADRLPPGQRAARQRRGAARRDHAFEMRSA